MELFIFYWWGFNAKTASLIINRDHEMLKIGRTVFLITYF